MYEDFYSHEALSQAAFNDAMRPIVERALTKDTPYWTAVIWVHSRKQQDWGKALTQEVADEIGQDKCLREVDRIIFLYVSLMSRDIPLGTILWIINYRNPEASRKDVPDFDYERPLRKSP